MHGIIYRHIARTDLDGSTDKNLPYFVVENLATLCVGLVLWPGLGSPVHTDTGPEHIPR